jgi:hypothetical protein
MVAMTRHTVAVTMGGGDDRDQDAGRGFIPADGIFCTSKSLLTDFYTGISPLTE